MVSLDDINSDYIMQSYIAESGKITAVISDISRVDNNLYVEFSIGDIQYAISVPTDIYTDSEHSLYQFVADVKDSESAWSEFDLRDLIGHEVILYVDETLDWIKVSEDGYEYPEKQCDSTQELSESFIDKLNLGLRVWGQYMSNRDKKFGWRQSIESVTPVTEDTISISVDTGIEIIEWELELPDTRSKDSAIVRFIDSVGSPKMMKNEYVTVVHKSDTSNRSRIIEWSECGEWGLMIPEEFAEQKEYKAEQRRQERREARIKKAESVVGGIWKITIAIGIIGVIILVSGLIVVEISDTVSNDSADELATIDHEYPNGALTVLLTDSEIEEVIVQADGNQYTIEDPPSVLHLSSTGSEDDMTYRPGENITVLVFTETTSQTIHYDTSSQSSDTDVETTDSGTTNPVNPVSPWYSTNGYQKS